MTYLFVRIISVMLAILALAAVLTGIAGLIWFRSSLHENFLLPAGYTDI